MMSSDFNIASISDVHLGHPNTPTKGVLDNLRRAFPDNEETGKLDMIWIGGDLFDRSMSLHDPNVTEIKIWAYWFLRMCAKRKIKVRVLEGTPSHDWRQNLLLVSCNELGRLGADLKYVDTLSIEHLDDLNLDILYIPDEWTPETDDTWVQTLQLLKTHGLEKVDYAVIHGSFTFQLPAHVKTPMHIPERYLSIVRKYIFVGHVHKHGQYERILANGSFDRLTHGEEEAKGHWRVKVGGANGDELVFVENTGAKIYKTVDCSGLPVEDALKKVDAIAKLPEGSHLRIAATKQDPILASMDLMRRKYPHLHLTSKVTEGASVQANLLVDLRSTFQQINITSNNITELVMSRLRTMTTDDRVLARCAQRLSEIVS